MKPSINKMDPAEDAEHGRERVGEQVSTSMNSDRRESLLDVAVGDAFGQSLVAYLNDGSSWHAIERDDGLLEIGGSAKYFALPAEWDPLERLALNRTGVNVLDLGCGAGRAALALQERGKKVLAVDTSAGAIEVCQRRGVRETLHGDVSVVSAQDFDTVVMLGSGLGLLESSERAPLV